MRNLVSFLQFKKRENTHGGVIILVKLKAKEICIGLTYWKILVPQTYGRVPMEKSLSLTVYIQICERLNV